MRRPRFAALAPAVLAGVLLAGAVCADARTAFAFEELPQARPPRRTHLAAYACGLAGAGLVAVSFPLGDAADRRYGEYLRETRPEAIPDRWRRTVWADRVASGALLTGESLLVTAVWLRFLRQPAHARVALVPALSGCVVSCSF